MMSTVNLVMLVLILVMGAFIAATLIHKAVSKFKDSGATSERKKLVKELKLRRKSVDQGEMWTPSSGVVARTRFNQMSIATHHGSVRVAVDGNNPDSINVVVEALRDACIHTNTMPVIPYTQCLDCHKLLR